MITEALLRVVINGLVVAGFTIAGSTISFTSVKMPRWGLDAALSFAAGVMLVTSFVGLITPAFASGLYLETGLGIFTGIVTVALLDVYLPHEHFIQGYEGPESLRKKLKKAILVAIAIMLHNIPEGLSVGVTTVFSEEVGFFTTIAIGIQDVPEGIAVALPLAVVWSSRLKGFLVGALSGLAEAVMAIIGALVFSATAYTLGFGMGFASGAMIYVVVEEILPEVFHEGSTHRRAASIGFFIGFFAMLYLDILLTS